MLSILLSLRRLADRRSEEILVGQDLDQGPVPPQGQETGEPRFGRRQVVVVGPAASKPDPKAGTTLAGRLPQ